MARTPKPWYRPQRKTWYVCINGVQHNLGRNKKQAFAAYQRLMRQPPERKVVSQSLAPIVDDFLEWVQHHRAPDTYEWYRYRLERFVQRYPDLRVEELRPFHVQKWVDSYPDLAKTSRRNYLRSVKRCIDWARKQGYIQDNPLEYLEVPAGDRREVMVTAEEFAELLSYVRNDAFRDLLVTTWEAGCRPQESLRVEARHVDLQNERWLFPCTESKGKRAPRVVYLTPEALHITRRLMLKHPDGPLFRNTRGGAWTTEAVNCCFTALRIRMGTAKMKAEGVSPSEEDIAAMVPTLKQTRRSAGQEVTKTRSELKQEARRKLRSTQANSHARRYSLYALRHSFSTRGLERGVPSLTIAILLGHKDPSMLARVYQHLSLNPQHLLEQVRRISTTA